MLSIELSSRLGVGFVPHRRLAMSGDSLSFHNLERGELQLVSIRYKPRMLLSCPHNKLFH